jgi:hypothetical protein
MITQMGFRECITSFSSAGGWVGSLQYILESLLHRKMNLINIPVMIIVFYPLEWLLDRFLMGDIFVITARKQ